MKIRVGVMGSAASESARLETGNTLVDKAERLARVIAGKEVIITGAHVKTSPDAIDVGSALMTEDKELAVQTGDGLLVIDSLKPAGKNEMAGRDFLAGYGRDL